MKMSNGLAKISDLNMQNTISDNCWKGHRSRSIKYSNNKMFQNKYSITCKKGNLQASLDKFLKEKGKYTRS